MPTQQRKPTDYTGRQRDKLTKQYAEAVAAREGEVTMITGGPGTASDEVTDYSEPVQQIQNEAGEVEYVSAPNRTIRVNATIEQMTFGAGNNLDFIEGQQYTVSAALADYLEELGYVWH